MVEIRDLHDRTQGWQRHQRRTEGDDLAAAVQVVQAAEVAEFVSPAGVSLGGDGGVRGPYRVGSRSGTRTHARACRGAPVLGNSSASTSSSGLRRSKSSSRGRSVRFAIIHPSLKSAPVGMLGPVPVGAGAAGRTVALARENGVLTRSLARVGVALLPALTISEAEVEEIPARVRRALDGL